MIKFTKSIAIQNVFISLVVMAAGIVEIVSGGSIVVGGILSAIGFLFTILCVYHLTLVYKPSD